MVVSYRRCLLWFVGFSVAVVIFILYMQDTNIIDNILHKHTVWLPSTLRNFNRGNTALAVPTDKDQSSEVATSQGLVKVVILTYMRSGSSFTGDLIQQHPDVFYVYEPLLTTHKIYEDRSQDSFTFLDGSIQRAPTNEPELRTQNAELLRTILDCRFKDVNIETLQQNHMYTSKSTRNLWRCLYRQIFPMETCLESVSEMCQSSRVKLIKVIRANMTEAEALLNLDPSVRIIHLLRDPRGTSRSRIPFEGLEAVNDVTLPQNLCQRQAMNMELSIQISQNFPGRILTVRYEDLVDAPVSSTKELYTFLGLTMTPDIENYIQRITFGGLKDNCLICTIRKNSTETAYRWRQELSFKQVELIQSQCEDVLNMLGQRIFQSESELRDERLRSKLDDYSSKFMKLEPPHLIT